jgi:hypothetical protein
VPVRYDPNDRNKIELDEDALRARQQRARDENQRHIDQVNERAVRAAEARLEGRRPSPGPGRLP